MNETTSATPPTQNTAPKKTRKRRTFSPSTPREIDPEIKALQEEHKRRVIELRNRRRSAALLKTILDKRLAQMTDEDKNKLADTLRSCSTLPLPPTKSPAIPDCLKTGNHPA